MHNCTMASNAFKRLFFQLQCIDADILYAEEGEEEKIDTLDSMVYQMAEMIFSITVLTIFNHFTRRTRSSSIYVQVKHFARQQM